MQSVRAATSGPERGPDPGLTARQAPRNGRARVAVADGGPTWLLITRKRVCPRTVPAPVQGYRTERLRAIRKFSSLPTRPIYGFSHPAGPRSTGGLKAGALGPAGCGR